MLMMSAMKVNSISTSIRTLPYMHVMATTLEGALLPPLYGWEKVRLRSPSGKSVFSLPYFSTQRDLGNSPPLLITLLLKEWNLCPVLVTCAKIPSPDAHLCNNIII